MTLLLFSYIGIVGKFSLCLFSVSPATDDFSIAIQNYDKGNYRIAQVFLEHFIYENPDDTLIPEANYYLLKIAEEKDDFVKFFDLANHYLETFKHNKRTKEIFNLLLQNFVKRGSFALAFEYLRKYDFLPPDTGLVRQLVLTLATQEYYIDELLQFLPENDSLKILKALSLTDFDERIKILKTVKDPAGKLYLAENYLLRGDTLGAYDEYQHAKSSGFTPENICRWARVVLEFNKAEIQKMIFLMEKYPELEEKRKLLNMFITRRLADHIVIRGKEDIEILQRFWSAEHLDSMHFVAPEGIKIDSILDDTVNAETKLLDIRKDFAPNFFLDSMCCTFLLKKQMYAQAYEIVKQYLKYYETEEFARTVRALKYYEEKNYRMALNDIIHISIKDDRTKFIYAECLEYTDHNPSSIYEELVKESSDSLLRLKSLINYINYEFQNCRYSAITKLNISDFQGDTSLIKLYVLSLVHTGRVEHARSVYQKFFGEPGLDFHIAEVEYLVKNKFWKKAGIILDSLIGVPDYRNDEYLYYNACMVPFRSGDYIIAEARFADFKRKFKKGKYYYSALFKLGTLKYLKQDFDSAAYYYGMAVKDSLLRIEALQNQMLAYKKAEKWQEVIKASKTLVDIGPDSIRADCQFEIGYAFLRIGNVVRAIDHIGKAVRARPLVDYHYWLGEAYLARGDFTRALYQYEKIINGFAKDEMWYPTAFFKVGLTLEMLDEIGEAKKVYNTLIKERGTGDIWSIEAQKRLGILNDK